MTHYLRTIPELFRVGFAGLVAYRFEMVIWILTATMPLIMLALWNAVAADGPVQGWGATELTRYFAATLVVRQLTSSWLLWQLNMEIRSGSLSMKLLRPIHPLWISAIEMPAAMPMRILVLMPMLVGLVLWRPELLVMPPLWAMALFVPSVFLAWLLGYLVQAAFGCLAFWVDQSQGIFGLWFSVWMLLSGYLAPLDLFPASMQTALVWLPFRGMLAAPVELLSGTVTWHQALLDLGIQCGWAALCWALVVVMWRQGLQRYGAFGA